MKFKRLLSLVQDEPVFESALLLAGKVDPQLIRLSLARWLKSGKVYRLRRGVYALSPPYQKVKPHPFLVANRLQPASYVSAEAALGYYGIIPDTVQVITSVTTGRTGHLKTPLGAFTYRHIQPNLFFGYRMVNLDSQQALVAAPEKALLDLIYLQPGGETLPFLQELRLQNLDQIDMDLFQRMASQSQIPKLIRAVEKVSHLANAEAEEYMTL